MDTSTQLHKIHNCTIKVIFQMHIAITSMMKGERIYLALIINLIACYIIPETNMRRSLLKHRFDQ